MRRNTPTGAVAAFAVSSGRLDTFDYELCLETLDHMEVTPDGRIWVVFLAGIVVTV